MTFYQDLLQEKQRLQDILADCQETRGSPRNFSHFTGRVDYPHLHYMTEKVQQQTEKELELTELLIQIEDEAAKRSPKTSTQTRYWTRSSVLGTKEQPIVVQ